jgi:hypothetical protein
MKVERQRERVDQLYAGNHGIWEKRVLASTLKHPGCKVAHDGLRLYREVPQHLIGPPASQEANCIVIHVGIK